jgi:hypothetical protein
MILHFALVAGIVMVCCLDGELARRAAKVERTDHRPIMLGSGRSRSQRMNPVAKEFATQLAVRSSSCFPLRSPASRARSSSPTRASTPQLPVPT